jgi:hypothetical protein
MPVIDTLKTSRCGIILIISFPRLYQSPSRTKYISRHFFSESLTRASDIREASTFLALGYTLAVLARYTTVAALLSAAPGNAGALHSRSNRTIPKSSF